MKLPISERLSACCNYVNQGDRVADIGCDHGYLGIYLLQNGIASSIIASDMNEMPLQGALHNAVKYGVREQMQFYLSNGVQSIPRDFDVLVCAGMGADTIIRILEAAPWLKDAKYRLILQCQSQRPKLRRWLNEEGYAIGREVLAQDGKILYPVMEVSYAPGQVLTPGGLHISPALLESRSPLLPVFYERVVEGMRTTVNGLSHSGKSHQLVQYQAALEELEKMEERINGNRG